jgi:hypothetical protein
MAVCTALAGFSDSDSNFLISFNLQDTGKKKRDR